MPSAWKAKVPHTAAHPASTEQGDLGVHGVPVTTRRLLIEIELVSVAIPPTESATRTVKRYVPRFVGVPVTWPSVPITSPVGSAPSLMSHAYGAAPPVAVWAHHGVAEA